LIRDKHLGSATLKKIKNKKNILGYYRIAEEAASRATLVDAYQLLRPRTETSIRNRYLYKVGANLPGHLGHGGLMVPAHLRS
jgi:hypothetical protein